MNSRKGHRIGLCLGVAVFCLLIAGCKTGYYREDADKDVYAIIDQAEREVFGAEEEQEEQFTIETTYSGRTPEEILSGEIVEDRQKPGERFLPLNEALDLAVRNSREYQTEKERLYLTALGLTGERYAFSPHFFAASQGTFTRDADGERSGEVNSAAGLTQFFKSGGSLTLTLANDFLRYYTGDPRKSVVSSMSLNLVQPLLRGAGSKIAAENLKQAERDVIYAIRSYSQYQRQFAVDIVLDYFGLLQDKDQLRNAWEDYQSRLDTIEYTRARGEAGKQSQLEVDEARSDEQTAKNSYILTATAYLNNLDRFKITLGLPLTTKLRLDDAALENLENAGLKPLRLDREQAFLVAVENQLELLNDIDRFEDSKRQVAVTADRLKADLDLFGDLSHRTEDGTTDYLDFDINDVRANVGIELDLPIDRLIERNQYRASLVSFESSIRVLSRALDDKKDEIDRGLRNLESLRRSYFIQTNSVTIARRRVAGEQLALRAGRRSVINVRDAQNTLIDAENDQTAALVSHLAAKLQLLLDIGILDTDVDRFWLDPKAITRTIDTLPQNLANLPSDEEILPPETIFER